MIRHLLIAAPLALCLYASTAAAQVPPPEYKAYIAAVRKADAITDPLQRCLAYPDLPGNSWAPGVAEARCTMFLTPAPYTLDDIETTLAHPGGAAKLDAGFRALLDAHFQDPALRERITIAFRVFDVDEDGKAERIARTWLAGSKGSPYARTALAQTLERRGWNARGGKLVRDTPADNFRKMEAAFAEALKEYALALEAESRMLPACVGLMGIGRQSSDALQSHATARCLEADPASYFVIDELMTAAEPRWGGSEQEMRGVAAYAKARESINPVLAVFDFYHAAYEIARMDDGDAQAIAVLEPAALQVPNAGYMRQVGGAYFRSDDHWKAFAYLSQALRFSPNSANESRYRAHVLHSLQEPAWARADAERAVALDPKSGRNQQTLGRIVRELDGPVAALPYFERAKQDSDTRESAFNNTCGVLIDARRMAEAGRCVDELLAGYPINPEGWRQRLLVIGLDAPGSMEAVERFLALHDPKRWPHHADAAKAMRMVVRAANGTASPEEMFEVRLARGTAMEHTEAGMAYMAIVIPQAGRQLEQAFGKCRAHEATGEKEIAVAWDVLADGTSANVAIEPRNPWTACLAKQWTTWKLPAPPKGHAPSGYPMTSIVRLRAARQGQ